MTPGSHISVVVPVYNERENIGACLRKLWAALKDVPHEILVCYDFDEDTTLVGIAEMSDRPPSVRLVKNTIGRGAANALRAGFRAATGDVVVTTMADLSDPPEVIARMAELMRRENLAVVAGSRYMRGGSQTGGPLLKRTLSHTAGVSLRWVAGVGTNDATSNFRAYSRSFLNAVTIESRGGFEIALELTVKAHLAGLGVGEVPSSWTDRTAGESRFRLWKWLPHYLKWWLRAAWQPLVVWALWLWMTIGAAVFVGTYASPIPVWDDLELAPLVEPGATWTLTELWTQHNEHRLPVPRFVVASWVTATHDVRAPMFLDVALLSAIALVTMLAARKVRGRMTLVECVYPLLFLHVGNAENLLMAFQVALILPTALVVAVTVTVLRRGARFTWPRALALGFATMLLPLCGGPGLTQAPVVLAGLACLGFALLRRGEASARRAGAWMLSFAAITVGWIAFYFVGFEFPSDGPRARTLVDAVTTAARVSSSALGVAGEAWWPWSGVVVLTLTASALVVLARAWMRRRGERVRVGALVFGLAAVVLLVGSIGLARGGAGADVGFAMRYVTLPAPLIAWSVLAWSLYGSKRLALIVGTATTLTVLAANVFVNEPAGREYGAARIGISTEMRDEMARGVGPAEFLDRFTGRIYPDRERLQYLLSGIARAKLAPFDAVSDAVRTPYTWRMFNRQPVRVVAPESPIVRLVDGTWEVLALPSGSELEFELAPEHSRVTGSFGVPLAAIQAGRTHGLRVDIELVAHDGQRRTLLSRTLDPVHVDAERGAQAFDLELGTGAGRRLVMRLQSPTGTPNHDDWGYLGDVTFR